MTLQIKTVKQYRNTRVHILLGNDGKWHGYASHPDGYNSHWNFNTIIGYHTASSSFIPSVRQLIHKLDGRKFGEIINIR